MANNVEAEYASCPFEGPEKLLEIWFAPSAAHVPDAKNERSGLRTVERKVWKEMLDVVKCEILSVVYGEEMDAYLLSESSFFVSPHRLILKACGRTLNLYGLPHILAIAREHAGLDKVYQCFYSRKAFMFPDQQDGPHRGWKHEIDFLDKHFEHGSAYTVGRSNGDHWLLYMAGPGDVGSGSGTETSSQASSVVDANEERWAIVGHGRLYEFPVLPYPQQDYTIEILMTHLSSDARAAFYKPKGVSYSDADAGTHAQQLSADLGIADLFPRGSTQLDAYSFSPCGYSANALISWTEEAVHEGGERESRRGEGYYTIHVTPEEGWSYASFECNIPLATQRRPGNDSKSSAHDIPDLRTLVQRVVRIFEPDKLTMTLFVASADNKANGNETDDDDATETAVEAAQRAFKGALTRPGRLGGGAMCAGGESSLISSAGRGGFDRVYKRTDKINYEFGGYDLAYASLELI